MERRRTDKEKVVRVYWRAKGSEGVQGRAKVSYIVSRGDGKG